MGSSTVLGTHVGTEQMFDKWQKWKKHCQLVIQGFFVTSEMCISRNVRGVTHKSTSYRVRGNLRAPITKPLTVLIRKLRPRRVKRLVQGYTSSWWQRTAQAHIGKGTLGYSLPQWHCRVKDRKVGWAWCIHEAMTNVNPNVSPQSSKIQCPTQILLDCCLIQHTGDWDPVKLLHSGDCWL